MKAYLKFDLPEEREEFEDALNGTKYKVELDNVWEVVFRPYYKHGYEDSELNTLLETEEGGKIIDKLAELFRNIRRDD